MEQPRTPPGAPQPPSPLLFFSPEDYARLKDRLPNFYARDALYLNAVDYRQLPQTKGGYFLYVRADGKVYLRKPDGTDVIVGP